MVNETRPEPSNALEIRDPAIDVDKIMARIRQNIEEKKKSNTYIEEPWMLQDLEPHLRLRFQKTSDTLAMLQITGRLELEGQPIRSHRPMFGVVITSLKRFVRFWIRKYTDAIFLKQNYFNQEIVRVMSQLHEEVQELREENERLHKEIASLSEKQGV